MEGFARKRCLDMKSYCKICTTQNKNISMLFMIEDPEKDVAYKLKKYDFQELKMKLKTN